FRSAVQEPDQRWERRGVDQHLVADHLVIEMNAPSHKIDTPRSAAQLDEPDVATHGAGELTDSVTRIQKVRVVAELAIVQPDCAGDHVLERGERHEALAPGAGNFAGRHPPETGVIRDHEVSAETASEMDIGKILESFRLRLGLREVRL